MQPLRNTVIENFDYIRQQLNAPTDLITRKITIGSHGVACGIVFMEELSDMNMLNDVVIKNLQRSIFDIEDRRLNTSEIFMHLRDSVLAVASIENMYNLDEIVQKVLEGYTAIFLDHAGQAVVLDTQGWKDRNIEESPSEKVVRGPRDGFIENISVNLSLVRRKLMDPNLHVRTLMVGTRSKKKAMICYMDGVVQQTLIEEVERRLSTLHVDNVPETGTIEQWIEDSFLSPFPQMENTERPDKVVSAISGGRAAILLDGTPFALIVPATLTHFMQAQEDDYDRWQISTFLRLLRYTAAFITVFLPAIFIALIEYHHGLIPSRLAFSIAGSRQGVPFPAFIEAYMMEFTMEILREAGIRLPTPVGQTIGIVGGLVIGEAAVMAGIISPIMVIIVALTAISSFTLPSYNFATSLRLLRFLTMAAAAIFGLFGIVLAFITICIHITNLNVYGIPYSAPLAPGTRSDWKTMVVRFPLLFMRRRSHITQPQNPVRRSNRS